MAADAGVSLGVVVAGLFIILTGKTWIDPVTSFLIMPGGYNDRFIAELQKDLEKQFDIVHTTFQIEDEMIEKECRICC
jgi:hypothetical protein